MIPHGDGSRMLLATPVLHTVSGGSNSGAHGSTANAPLTASSPQPCGVS